VVEGGAEALGAAAVSHVHADDVAAGVPELGGVADDVLGVRGAFEAVEDEDGEARGPDFDGLPMTFAEDLAGDLATVGRVDFDELGDGLREGVGARKEVANDGLKVAVTKPGARDEGSWIEGGFGLRRH
jgi:hypothetical protein